MAVKQIRVLALSSVKSAGQSPESYPDSNEVGSSDNPGPDPRTQVEYLCHFVLTKILSFLIVSMVS
jgi:hypothetical protein